MVHAKSLGSGFLGLTDRQRAGIGRSVRVAVTNLNSWFRLVDQHRVLMYQLQMYGAKGLSG